MGQINVVSDMTQGQVNALFKKLGPMGVNALLASRRILRLVMEDHNMRYTGEVEFPAIPDSYVGDLNCPAVWERITGSHACSSALRDLDLDKPVLAAPAIQVMTFQMEIDSDLAKVRKAIWPNGNYPESLDVLRARVIRYILRRQPHGQAEGGIFAVGRNELGRPIQNIIPIASGDGGNHSLMVIYNFLPSLPKDQNWQVYTVEDDSRDYARVYKGDRVFCCEAMEAI